MPNKLATYATHNLCHALFNSDLNIIVPVGFSDLNGDPAVSCLILSIFYVMR